MVSKRLFLGIALVSILIISLSFIISGIVVTTFSGGTSFAFTENVSHLYNFSINNTEIISISKINITFPAGLVPDTSTIGTSAPNITFAVRGQALEWTNFTNLILNQTVQYFWVNATATNYGIYNITIYGNFTNSSISLQSILVSINDTTKPSVTVVYPKNYGNYSTTNMSFNLTVTDNVQVKSCMYNINNGTNYTFGNTTASSFNVTNSSIANGIQYLARFYCNDTNSNVNTTSVIFTIDTIVPSISSLSKSSSTKTSITVSYSCTDAISNVSSCILSSSSGTVSGSTISDLSCGNTYNITASAEDYAGNTDSSIISLSTDDCAGDSSIGGGTVSAWTNTFVLDSSQFTAGATKELGAKARFKFTINNVEHSAGVIALTSTTATINISSIPQQATLNIGDERRFEVTSDTYYDIYVKLNSIFNNKANITIKSIHELITSETQIIEEAKEEEEAKAAGTGEAAVQEAAAASIFTKTWFWAVIVAIVIIAAALIYNISKKKR